MESSTKSRIFEIVLVCLLLGAVVLLAINAYEWTKLPAQGAACIKDPVAYVQAAATKATNGAYCKVEVGCNTLIAGSGDFNWSAGQVQP